MTLEERASEAGESSLGICLSKPLMRLSKLPLLMQALLYHTGENICCFLAWVSR
jgi:hypothetical protein